MIKCLLRMLLEEILRCRRFLPKGTLGAPTPTPTATGSVQRHQRAGVVGGWSSMDTNQAGVWDSPDEHPLLPTWYFCYWIGHLPFSGEPHKAVVTVVGVESGTGWFSNIIFQPLYRGFKIMFTSKHWFLAHLLQMQILQIDSSHLIFRTERMEWWSLSPGLEFKHSFSSILFFCFFWLKINLLKFPGLWVFSLDIWFVG